MEVLKPLEGRCLGSQILKIVELELELELPEHLAPEPRCTLWPWVSQRHS
jgi:hypothetical protein